MGPRKLSRDINMKYTYELKYEIRLKKEKMFFVYESENEIQSNVSSIKDILFSVNRKEGLTCGVTGCLSGSVCEKEFAKLPIKKRNMRAFLSINQIYIKQVYFAIYS